MIKTEMMKRYEQETGEDATVIMFEHFNLCEHKYTHVCGEKYVGWLEVKTKEIVRTLNAICMLFDDGKRKITVGERANFMIAKALIEKYPQEWVE